MAFHIRGNVLSHIQGFLTHLLTDDLVLVAFQPLSLLSLNVRDGLVQILQQVLGKQAKDKQNEGQGNDPRHYPQSQDLTGETLEKRQVYVALGHSSLNPLFPNSRCGPENKNVPLVPGGGSIKVLGLAEEMPGQR